VIKMKNEKRKAIVKELAIAKAYLKVWYNSEDVKTKTNSIYEVIGRIDKALELLCKDKTEYEMILWALNPTVEDTIKKNDLQLLKCKICNL